MINIIFQPLAKSAAQVHSICKGEIYNNEIWEPTGGGFDWKLIEFQLVDKTRILVWVKRGTKKRDEKLGEQNKAGISYE